MSNSQSKLQSFQSDEFNRSSHKRQSSLPIVRHLQPISVPDNKCLPEQLHCQTQVPEIGVFASKMVHEIRNSLASILITLDHCKKLELEPSSQARLDLALESSHHLNNLANEALCCLKPQVIQLEWVNIKPFCQSILDEVAVSPVAQDRSITLESDSTAIWVEVAPDQFKQAWVHLLQNALEAIAPNQSVICSLQASQNEVSLEVRNMTNSVAPETIQQWNQPFYSTKIDGVGLGLIIAQQIIEAHGGQLSLFSDHPQMICASVTLPLRSRLEPVGDRAQASSPRRRTFRSSSTLVHQ